MKIYFKRFLIFALTALLIIAPPVSYAASPAGWAATAANTVMSGATATITAFKGSGSNALKAVVSHKPTAVAVGKEIVKGGGALALAYATSKLLDAGIDWVLDPANNRIIVTEPDDGGGVGAGTGQYYYTNYKSLKFSSPMATCQSSVASFGATEGKEYINPVVISNPTSPGSYVCWAEQANAKPFVLDNIWRRSNPAYDPDNTTGGTKERYIPIADVSPKVLENAEAGHPASQEFVKGVALEQVATGELDTALEAVAEPTTDTANPDAPAEPTDPAEPFDPTSIIDAIKSLGAILGGLIASVTSISDFMQSEPPPPPTDNAVVLDESVTDFETDKKYVTFTGACPANYTASLNVLGNTVPFSFDYVPICTVMSALKPFIVGAGYLTAAYIIAGFSRGNGG